MKKIIMILMMAGALYADSFCDGFQLGYEEGWCYRASYYCIRPITPICPIARIGERTFQDGYNRGFLLGFYRNN